MVSIKHAFQSEKTDDPAASADGQITPSRWNADLDTEMATARILGRNAAGTGAIEELDAATARSLLQLVKGTSAGNIPVLDGSGKLDTSILPSLAITETFVVNSQSAMLALAAQTGDVAIRTDLNKTLILSTNNPGTLADWKEMLTPTDLVLSVAGLTGAISASALKAALAIAAADITDASANARSLITAADYAAMRTLLGLVVGTNVQAFNAKLNDIATATFAAGDAPVWDGTNFVPQAAGGGGVDVSRKGWVATATLTSGSGQDAKYTDVTVSAVSDYTKTEVIFSGGATTSAGNYASAVQKSGTSDSFTCSSRMVNNTTVRISCNNAGTNTIAGYFVIEDYN